MDVATMTAQEIQQVGFKALVKELGVDGAIRFIQQYDNGSGDYTKERHKWLDKYSVDDLYDKIRKNRKKDTYS